MASFNLERHLEEVREAGLDSFPVFLTHLWHYLSLPDPTNAQYDIANYLQNGPRRRIVQAFRGVGKSWITVAYACWRALLDPEIKIMVVSAGGDIANDIASFAHTIIMEWNVMEVLRPGPKDKSSAVHFDFGPARPSKDASLKSVGITGQITSSRADLIIVDDVEIPKNSYTHLMRERLAHLVKEFDAVLRPGGEIIYLGTPQVEETLYNKLLTRGYERLVWPAEVPEHPERYRGGLAPLPASLVAAGVTHGTPTDPGRFDEQDLFERKLSYGRAGFALQYMLDTTSDAAEKHPLKTHNLILFDCDRETAPVQMAWGKDRKLVVEGLPSGGFDGDFYVRPAYSSDERAGYQGVATFIDPSGQGKDETSWAHVGLAHGMLYLLEVDGRQDGYGEETLQAIAASMLRWGSTRWVAEENYGGGMFVNLLKPALTKAGVQARYDDEYNGWATGQKERRICNVLEPLTQSHRLVVNRSVIEADLKVQERDYKHSLIFQYTRMSRDRGALAHEDRVEAVAGACSYWEEYMVKDVEQSEEAHQERMLDQEIAKFLREQGVTGGHNWRNDRRVGRRAGPKHYLQGRPHGQ